MPREHWDSRFTSSVSGATLPAGIGSRGVRGQLPSLSTLGMLLQQGLADSPLPAVRNKAWALLPLNRPAPEQHRPTHASSRGCWRQGLESFLPLKLKFKRATVAWEESVYIPGKPKIPSLGKKSRNPSCHIYVSLNQPRLAFASDLCKFPPVCLRFKGQNFPKVKRQCSCFSYKQLSFLDFSSCDYANYTLKHNQYLTLLEPDQAGIHP